MFFIHFFIEKAYIKKGSSKKLKKVQKMSKTAIPYISTKQLNNLTQSVKKKFKKSVDFSNLLWYIKRATCEKKHVKLINK